jgi:hypothetical protein
VATAKLERILTHSSLFLALASLASCSKRAAHEAQPAPSASVAQAPQPPHDAEAEAAWIQAQVFVKRRLYSPGTAVFGSPSGQDQAPENVVQRQADGRYLIKGWVEGADPTGKMVRMSFELTLHSDQAAEGGWVVDSGPTVKVL